MAVPSPAAEAALAPFHPLVREWFTERFDSPTDVQRRAWPEIAAGRHVLVTAPTGTGKTLTAFLWALDRLLSGEIPGGAVRVLYVSPLKALNTDVRRNLDEPLAELVERFRAAGEPVPSVRALTRSGDTPQSERQKMLRRPPEILITTPESLNILLTSAGGRSLLGNLTTVILDEIHAVAGSKRGTHLLTAVERLVPLAGEFQRIALSATVRPLPLVAEMVGGRELLTGAGGEPVYRSRPVTAIRSQAEKVYDLSVRFPGPGDPSAPRPDEDPETSVWDLLVPELQAVIQKNRSTLVFANSRRTTERLTRMVNARSDRDLAYSHHGSLSREVRQVVERRLKAGELPAIIATSSLELGIDIGALDEVVLVQTPFSIASTLQRVGRAGHRVGEVSRGLLLPTHGRDFLDAAVVSRAVAEGEIEAVHPVEAPLDVLAQVILSMVAAETWGIDALYDRLRTAWPYRNLPRRHYELVLEMLAGRYADSRVRELSPRVSVDRVEGTVRARAGAARLVYLSGGTIPDRGYFHLRVEGGADGPGAKIGELDEEFVWERSVGDSFTLGTQVWRVRRITHNDVIVEPARASAAMAPFWRADERDREFFLAERVGLFLEAMEPRLEKPDAELLASLASEHRMEAGAAAELVRYLRSQKAALGARLPHRHRLMIEHVGLREGSEAPHPDQPDRRRVVLHTFWGGRVNRPLAIALAAAWEERFGERPEIFQDDDCLMLTLPEALAGEDLLALVPPERVEELLRRRLESTGFFGALFRQNAGRALLLPRAGFRHRMPLWVTRERAKRLLDAVGRYGDFPLVLETWRSCLEDELDLETLRRLLEEVRAGEIEVRHAATDTPSPFAAHLLWKQTNSLMYADDTPAGPEGARGPALSPDLLRELVFASRLRPRVPPRLVAELQAKLQRTAPGYAPRDAGELLDWLRERLLVPLAEWRDLLAAVARDGQTRDRARAGGEGEAVRVAALADLEAALVERAVVVHLPGAALPAVAALETVPRLRAALETPALVSDLVLASLLDPDRPAPAAALENLALLERRRAPDISPDAGAEEDDGGDPVADLVGEWLRFYGPVEEGYLRQVFGGDGMGGAVAERLAEALEVLVDDQQVVVDQLVRDAAGTQVCDADNLETLLRWTRAAARPAFEALPLERLPLFLASHQGVATPGGSLEDLQERLEPLLGHPLPARLWETEVLPARLAPYHTAWLDTLMRESELGWVGVGERRIAFVFPAERELMADPDDLPAPPEPVAPEAAEAAILPGRGALFPDRRGRYTLGELAEHSGRTTGELTSRLWELAWQGRVTNDSFQVVRNGVLRKFRAPEAVSAASQAAPAHGVERPSARGRVPRRRGAFDRWQSGRTFAGHWYPLPLPFGELPADDNEAGEPAQPLDPLEREELAKERARLVLDRYGVVFRELLAREPPVFQWSRLFRALRLMELSGEILAGQFFRGVPGLQFASHTAFRRLRDELLEEDVVWWLDAADPASLAGVDLPELKAVLPERRPGNHVVFHGERLVVVSTRRGRRLEIRAAPEDPRLGEYLGFLKVALTRDFAPRRAVEVEEINGEPAPASPYRERLRELFSATVEPRTIKLRRRY